MNKGLFITFEGPDASGKSTQIRLLDGFLRERGINALLTREPGGTVIGEKIREVILDVANAEMDAMTETLLYAAARAQLVSEVIGPALDAGHTVICDRFVDSSLVYQGAGRGLGDVVAVINGFAVGTRLPELTFLIKVDPGTGRVRRQYQAEDRIEMEGDAWHRKVYEAYLELEARYPQRIIGIDGSADPAAVHETIRAHVLRFLKQRAASDTVESNGQPGEIQ